MDQLRFETLGVELERISDAILDVGQPDASDIELPLSTDAEEEALEQAEACLHAPDNDSNGLNSIALTAEEEKTFDEYTDKQGLNGTQALARIIRDRRIK